MLTLRLQAKRISVIYIHKWVGVSNWDEATRSKVRQYWEERGFRLNSSEAVTLSGRRGDWLSTLVSLNTTYMRTSLQIRYEAGGLNCELGMDTRVRIITKPQRRLLEFELEAFESFLLTGDRNEAAWARHHQDCRRANLNIIADSFANPFRPRKSRKPRRIGGVLVFQSWLFLGLGMLCLFCIFTLRYFMAKYHVTDSELRGDLASVPLTAGLLAASFVSLAIWSQSLWRSSKKCVNARQAGVLYGMDTQSMQKTIEQRGIKARFIIAGEPVYDLDDVSTSRLLRPVRNQTDETLLMPVNEAIRKTDELLVRPATDSINSIAANSVSESPTTIANNRQ